MTSTSTNAVSVSAVIALPGDASTSVGVGEPFWLAIEARHAPGRIALLPESVNLGGELAERTAARTHERARRGDEEIDLYRLELIAFESGDIEVPSIPLAIGSTTASTPKLTVLVTSGFSDDEAKVASSTLAEAMPELEKLAAQDPTPEMITAPDYTLAYGGAAVLLFAAIALIARQLMRRTRERAGAPPPPPPRPAHEVALEKLAALEAEGRPTEEALKEFFTRVSEILREYFGGRYAFDSLELTVDELTDALLARKTEGLDLQRLRDLLVRADLVKFAKYRATVDEGVEALAVARAIVEATRPKREPAA